MSNIGPYQPSEEEKRRAILKDHKAEGREFWKAAYLAAMVAPPSLGHPTLADDALSAFNARFAPEEKR